MSKKTTIKKILILESMANFYCTSIDIQMIFIIFHDLKISFDNYLCVIKIDYVL